MRQNNRLPRQPLPGSLLTDLCAPLQACSRAAAAAQEGLEAEVFSLQERLAAQAASHDEEAAELRKQQAELREIIDSSLHSRRAVTLKLDTTMHALNMSKGEAQQFLQVGGAGAGVPANWGRGSSQSMQGAAEMVQRQGSVTLKLVYQRWAQVGSIVSPSVACRMMAALDLHALVQKLVGWGAWVCRHRSGRAVAFGVGCQAIHGPCYG